ncbi:unnamed protein product [Nesidiocoris tenuis]|uniref:Uncharacterized protein n=1 Tax=Nesidiocoris tenuis TaxID=355587 RepID=A0A6H5H6E0_9HEMI|nr:unnamed protein product [Nesidiocoris tenuis]CAB0009178.1 unnamed protein product [Nesidiocoris tenuis]
MEAFRSLGFYQGFDPEETMKRLAARNLEYANSENAKTIFELSSLGVAARHVLGTTFLASCLSHIVLNAFRKVHKVLFCIHVLSDRVIHRLRKATSTTQKTSDLYTTAFSHQPPLYNLNSSLDLSRGFLRYHVLTCPSERPGKGRRDNGREPLGFCHRAPEAKSSDPPRTRQLPCPDRPLIIFVQLKILDFLELNFISLIF